MSLIFWFEFDMLKCCLQLWPLCWVLDHQLWESSSLKRCRQPWKPKIQKDFTVIRSLLKRFSSGFQNAEYKYRIYFRLRWLQEGFWLLSCPKLQLVFSFFRFSVDSNPNGGTLRNIYRCSLRLASTHHQYLRVKQAIYRCICVCCVLDATIKIDTMWQVNFDQLHP